MRIKYLFLLIIVAFLGCTSESIELTPEQTDNKGDYFENLPSDATDGVAYIKIKEQAHQALSIKASAGGVSTNVSEFDKLSRAYNVSTMVPVFKVSGRFEARKRKAGLHLWYRVEFDKQTPLKVALSGFSDLGMIDIVEPELKIVRIGDPLKVVRLTDSSSAQMAAKRAGLNGVLPYNDPELIKQWHYNNDGTIANTSLGADINLFKAWETTTGSPEVIVAVMDGGVDFNHDDLKANMWINTDKDETNPYKDGVHGWNFIQNSATITPDDHGTHVAGTVAAVNNNNFGGSGIAGGDGTLGSGVRIMSVQIGEGSKWGFASELAAAFVYAADNGAVIAQNSWARLTETKLDPLLKTGIDYFIDNAGMDENGVQTGPMKGGLVVFSAGNDGQSNNLACMPPAYSRVISVGNMGPDYRLAFHSQHGTWVSVVAPGGVIEQDPYTQVPYVLANGVLSTITNNGMGFMQGTSMAAPHVSGVAALAVSYLGVGQPGFTADNLKDRLQKGATKIDNLNYAKYHNKMGAGLIDANMVLTGIAPARSNPEPVTDLKCNWSRYSWLELEWSVTSDDTYGKAFAYDILLSEREITEADFATRPSEFIYVNMRTEAREVGAVMKNTQRKLKPGVKYYVAIKAISFDHGASTTARQSGVTTIGDAPDPVTDLAGVWEFDSATLSWKVTKDANTSRPDKYEILVSKNDLTGVDFENPPAEAKKYTIPVEHHAIGTTLTQPVRDLTQGTKYYASIQSVDIDNLRSEAMMITGNTKSNSPTVTNPIMTDILLVGLNESTTIDLKSYFDDPAGVENLTYTLEATPSDIAKFTTATTGVVTILSEKYGTTTVQVKATNALGVSVEHPTGFKVECKMGDVPPPIEDELKLYPNPVIDIMNIAMKNANTVEVALYNSMGARVFSQSVSVEPTKEGKIDLSRISGGVYTVVLKYEGKEVKQRIAKL